MANLVTTEANNILAASSGQAAFIAPSGGLNSQMVALITTTTPSTPTAVGSEVTGGSYVRKNVQFAAPAGGSITSSNTLTWTGMPACTVGGVEEWDVNGTTRRWFGLLSTPRTCNNGDTFSISAGSFTKNLS